MEPVSALSLTPRQIVRELDRFIVGQDAAKRAVAVALRNRHRRMMVAPEEREGIQPKNLLMLGPTGVGKTAIARRMAILVKAPFVKVEATKYTEVGYVGRDVESMIRDLVAEAVRIVQTERMVGVLAEAEEAARQMIAIRLDPELAEPAWGYGDDAEVETQDTKLLRRTQLAAEIGRGEHDAESVEIDVEEAQNPFLQVFTPQGIEEMGIDSLGPFGQTRTRSRRMTVGDARRILTEAEAKKRLDPGSVNREAIERAEQSGIVFIDEIDKIAMPSKGAGPDVSREGVQRDLLPVIEGSTVPTKFGPVRTEHVLFVAAGAFHMSKPSDLIPELQGRLPIRVELNSLDTSDLRRILQEPENALVRQYQALLETEGVAVTFADDALDEVALMAAAANEKSQNIGARRLQTMLERLLEPEMFGAPDDVSGPVHIDRATVLSRLGPLLESPELTTHLL